MLYTQHSQRLEENLINLRLYGNRNIQGFTGQSFDKSDNLLFERLTLNVIQSVIDAAASKISTNDTRTQFLTEGGKWKERQQAKLLTRFTDGQFFRNDTYEESEESFLDALIFDLGAMKHFIDRRDPENVKICSERAVPVELFVDIIDGRYRKPRQLYQVKEVGREVILGDPDFKSKVPRIHEATLMEPSSTLGESTLADPITLMETWHLPSAPNATDGKHVICVDSCTLLEEPWTWQYFPFSFYRWNKRRFGFYGQGLAEQLRTIQISINKILRKIEQHMDKASSFVLAERGAKIVKSHLVNTPWTLLEFTGHIPQFATVASISPEYFAQLDRMYSRAFEIAGISQLFAQSKMPGNLKSAKAISEAKDTESERFMKAGKAWSRFHIDIAAKQIELAQQVNKMTPGGYSVLAKNEDGSLDRIAWDEIDLDRDAYIMQPYPSSYMPKLPAFKIQAVQDLAEVMPELQPFVPKLLEDLPDLKAVLKRLNAPLDYIDKVTDRMLYEKAETQDELEELFEPPDAFTDLPMALQISKGKLLRAKMDGAPPERLDLLMRYMTEVENLLNPPMPPQPGVSPEMAAGAIPPGAVPPMPGVPASTILSPVAPRAGDITISPEINVPPPTPGGGF
jgi:hypothetical protein